MTHGHVRDTGTATNTRVKPHLRTHEGEFSMKVDDELSKKEMNTNKGQTMCPDGSKQCDKAVGNAPEVVEYVINEPVTSWDGRPLVHEEYILLFDSKAPMVSRVFAMVGMEYGVNASAEFAPFHDLYFNWSGNDTRFRFWVSDFLQDAPEGVLEGIARTFFSTLAGNHEGFPEETVRWLKSPEFLEKHRPLYLQRNFNVGS